jgi:hypothetical protein
MSRGWESTDVESQQEQRESDRREAAKPRLTPEQQAAAHRRAALELDRTRIVNEIAATQHPRRRQQLEAALEHLDSELAKV